MGKFGPHLRRKTFLLSVPVFLGVLLSSCSPSSEAVIEACESYVVADNELSEFVDAALPTIGASSGAAREALLDEYKDGVSGRAMASMELSEIARESGFRGTDFGDDLRDLAKFEKEQALAVVLEVETPVSDALASALVRTRVKDHCREIGARF